MSQSSHLQTGWDVSRKLVQRVCFFSTQEYWRQEQRGLLPYSKQQNLLIFLLKADLQSSLKCSLNKDVPPHCCEDLFIPDMNRLSNTNITFPKNPFTSGNLKSGSRENRRFCLFSDTLTTHLHQSLRETLDSLHRWKRNQDFPPASCFEGNISALHRGQWDQTL